jgi:hypothetical protein
MEKRTIGEQLGGPTHRESTPKRTIGGRIAALLSILLAVVVVGCLVFMGVIFALSGMRDVP